jgi:hypothetical protein
MVAAAMGKNGSAMGGKTAKQLQWATGQWWHNGQHNGRRRIAANAGAAQLEATQDRQQRQSQWTAVVWLRWTAAAATGNYGGAMGGRTAEQWWWAMRWRRGKAIAANAEAAQYGSLVS